MACAIPVILLAIPFVPVAIVRKDVGGICVVFGRNVSSLSGLHLSPANSDSIIYLTPSLETSYCFVLFQGVCP